MHTRNLLSWKIKWKGVSNFTLPLNLPSRLSSSFHSVHSLLCGIQMSGNNETHHSVLSLLCGKMSGNNETHRILPDKDRSCDLDARFELFLN